MCMQRNGFSFTVFLGEPDFYWFDWLKTAAATDFVSLVPRRKGMDFYRASNSRVGGALWKALYLEDGSMVKFCFQDDV
jgi:hypothetical protein